MLRKEFDYHYHDTGQGRIQDLKLGVAQDLKVRGGANGLENLKTTGGGVLYQ